MYEGVADNGEWVFKDVNGDGIANDLDEEHIGQGLPQAIYSLHNRWQWKKWDLEILMTGASGHDQAHLTRLFFENPIASVYNQVRTEYFNPSLRDFNRFNSHFMEDAGYVRMSLASLGYTWEPANSKVLNRLRLYLTGQNLFTWTDYTGNDPEVRLLDPFVSGNSRYLAAGMDRPDMYPLARTWVLGVEVGLE